MKRGSLQNRTIKHVRVCRGGNAAIERREETPRLLAAGGTPLARSFLADSIVLPVICRLRPPLRPR
jgi:hypothetical protein